SATESWPRRLRPCGAWLSGSQTGPGWRGYWRAAGPERRRERPSDHLDFSLEGAGGLDGLQDADHVARADAQRIQAVDQGGERGRAADDPHLAAGLLGDADVRLGHDHGLTAAAERL